MCNAHCCGSLLSIETADGLVLNLINRHIILLVEKSMNFTTFKDNQTSVIIKIFEGKSALATDNRLLGQFELTDLAPAPAGETQTEVTFATDHSDFLYVSAENKRTGKGENSRSRLKRSLCLWRKSTAWLRKLIHSVSKTSRLERSLSFRTP